MGIPIERKLPREQDVLGRIALADLKLSRDVARLLEARDAEIAKLRREGVPGVMHEADKAFYDLTVRERNYAEVKVANRESTIGKLEAQIAGLLTHIARLEADAADRDQDLMALQCERDEPA